MKKYHSTLDTTVVLDYGSGSIRTVQTYWADKADHHTVR